MTSTIIYSEIESASGCNSTFFDDSQEVIALQTIIEQKPLLKTFPDGIY